MDGAIYLRSGAGLVEMVEEAYDSESVLQRNLAEYPKLLAGDQMNEANPRRWLLIEREASVPDSETSGGRWSADHLFVDQDGVPTIVEVKRSEDTRSRRAVVGQMMDYAAHATTYWRDGRIEAQFELTCHEQDVDPREVLDDWLPSSTDSETFWNDVETNLRSGRIRMLFVADEIHRELKRIVEFLNEQMDVAEVLAVEVKQFYGGDRTALVPRLVGQTEQARQDKSRESNRSYEQLLLNLRQRIEARDAIDLVEGDLSDSMTKNPRRKLELKLPIDNSVAGQMIWEIQPNLESAQTVTFRLRSWNAQDGQETRIYDAVSSVDEKLSERDFELLLDGTHLVEKTMDVQTDEKNVVEEDVEAILTDFEWFANEVYGDVYPQLNP